MKRELRIIARFAIEGSLVAELTNSPHFPYKGSKGSPLTDDLFYDGSSLIMATVGLGQAPIFVELPRTFLSKILSLH